MQCREIKIQRDHRNLEKIDFPFSFQENASGLIFSASKWTGLHLVKQVEQLDAQYSFMCEINWYLKDKSTATTNP